MKRLIIFCAIIILAGMMVEAATPNLVVIANKGVKDATLSQNDIQDIYLGKKTKWSDNSEIKPAQLKEGELQDAFLKDLVKRSKRLYQNHWNKMVFTGQGFPPKTFKTQKELLEYVAETEGAIAYVTKGQETTNVKLLEVK